MTRAVALKDAQKNTPTSKAHQGRIIPLTEAEWIAECENRADKAMAGKKVKQLSGLFDAPQFALQWIELQHKAGGSRDLHVRFKSVLKDASGRPLINKKTGAPKVGWSVFDSRAA
ncbi:MAG: hypothetical protein ACKVIS_17395 [Pseudomonadales bacterium]